MQKNIDTVFFRCGTAPKAFCGTIFDLSLKGLQHDDNNDDDNENNDEQ